MTAAAIDQTPEVMTTADGIPLKVSLRRAVRREKMISMLLIAPLFLFIFISFIVPIADMLLRGVENSLVEEQLPRTVPLLAQWNPQAEELPDEAVFAAFVEDVKEGAAAKTINRVGRRLNYEKAGMSGLFRKTARKVKKIEAGPYKEAVLEIDKKWGKPETWTLIQAFSGPYTPGYILGAFDMELTDQGEMALKPEKRRIHLPLMWRTLWMSGIITLMTLLLGYPIAYLLATLPTRTSNLLIILVLLPFWTSLLVRTTSWIALLQHEGVFNDMLVGLGILSDENRLPLIHNRTGTIIAMTHILLPFMVLPLFSVMKTIPPSYMRAAKSLGATPFTAFVRVYMPNTVPGIGAGAILVFILAIGYYITPALVGGTTGTFISNIIADHISISLNWGLAAALGAMLLLLILALYILYDKVVGIDNMKLG